MSVTTVENVTVHPPTRIAVVLSNGKELSVDLSDWFVLPGFERLVEPEVFAHAVPEEWGHGVEWPDIDQVIPVETLVRVAREQTGDAFPVVEFNAWMERNGLSLSRAADALGLTRRTVVYYHMGHKPIPRHIGLACIGWEILRERAA
ncbi:DUF2442 domain-containing protein [Endothiovibrio diazotrophicus]